MKFCLTVVLLGALALPLRAGTLVQFDTSVGSMVFELFDEDKPQTTQLFLNWLNAGNYDGTYVHRATNNYLAQSGRYGVVDLGSPFGKLNIELPIAPDGSVPNEINVGKTYANEYGTIAMIPWTPASGSSDFFVTSGFIFNFGANTSLDDASAAGGFPVFGQLVSGWDTFALLNPTNGNPALRVSNFSETLPELPVRINAGQPLVFDDLIYLNMSVVPEPGTVVLLTFGGVLTWALRQRRR